jgi:plasmid stabilization system protein ParE
MVKLVLLTSHAKADLDSVTFYLFENWGLHVLENFLALYEAKIRLIAEYPARYPFIYQALELRKAVLTKHTIILYREKPEHIEIISLFDTRQDPAKINRML